MKRSLWITWCWTFYPLVRHDLARHVGSGTTCFFGREMSAKNPADLSGWSHTEILVTRRLVRGGWLSTNMTRGKCWENSESRQFCWGWLSDPNSKVGKVTSMGIFRRHGLNHLDVCESWFHKVMFLDLFDVTFYYTMGWKSPFFTRHLGKYVLLEHLKQIQVLIVFKQKKRFDSSLCNWVETTSTI